MTTRVSAFRGTWTPNRRPYVVLTPDVYVSIQGETSVIGCGECKREVNINRYLTSVSTEASIDSPPGSASVNLSIPDTDVNEFYSNNQFLIIPMMEIEIFAKGYYTVGGFPQYYKIFWGMVSSVTQNWSNGVTSISISCRDILRWWELSTATLNPAFLYGFTPNQYEFWGNKFAGMNAYAIILSLAKEAMGDFSHTAGSFNQFRPELGAEKAAAGQLTSSIIAYWQLKFGSFWNSLVLYGTSGQAYTFASLDKNKSPLEVSKEIFAQEVTLLGRNPQTRVLTQDPEEIAVFRKEIPKVVDINLMQAEQRSKLQIAMECRDQAGYEFYCDTTGDIVFKPPFYNLNVIPNKPTSWIQDFEIIDDSVTDSEAEVYTHIIASGNVFAGDIDTGIADEITAPRTGVYDFHLLRRYGWRKYEFSAEWAGDAKRLSYYLYDMLDRANAKRTYGNITIPMRPELRMGFPVWIPKYDSFFYINGISHNFSVGGQGTTVLTLTAKRGKFIAPKNIGKISKDDSSVPATGKELAKLVAPSIGTANPEALRAVKEESGRTSPTFTVTFPTDVGKSSGLNEADTSRDIDDPAILRNPETGKLMGFPNAVMVFRTTLNNEKIATIQAKSGSTQHHDPTRQNQKLAEGQKTQANKSEASIREVQNKTIKGEMVAKLRINRYEAAATSFGLYDYAYDDSSFFKEMSVIPASSISFGTGAKTFRTSSEDGKKAAETNKKLKEEKKDLEKELSEILKKLNQKRRDLKNQTRNTRSKLNKETQQQITNLESNIKSLKKSKSEIEKNISNNNKSIKRIDNEITSLEAQLKKSDQVLAKMGVGTELLLSKELFNNNTNIIKEQNKNDTLNLSIKASSVELKLEQGFLEVSNVSLDSINKSISDSESELNGIISQSGDMSLTKEISMLESEADTKQIIIDVINVEINSNVVLPDLSMLIRPVSDEFGFEVIGHYRYGRGAFMDQGKIKVQNTDVSVANDLNIQFSPVGGLIDNFPFVSANLAAQGPDILSFAKAFEQMTPTDWQTGSSFRGQSYGPKDALQNVNMTGQNTYQENIQKSLGSTVFVEADAVSKSRSLAELKPSINNGPLSSAITNCNCWLNKTQWLSVLPKSIIKQIVEQQGSRNIQLEESVDPAQQTAAITGDETGAINAKAVSSASGFFEVLNGFLMEKFNIEYKFNEEREKNDTSGSIPVFARPDFGTSNNIITDDDITGSPLFQRAALGDPDALEALQNDVNFDFGLTKKASKSFKEQFEVQSGKINQSIRELADFGTGKVPIPAILSASSNKTQAQQQLESSERELAKNKENLDKAKEILMQNPNSQVAQAEVSNLENQVAISEREVKHLQDGIVLQPNEPQIQPEANTPIITQIFDERKLAAAKESALINSPNARPKVTSSS
jgi:hypothetical protein